MKTTINVDLDIDPEALVLGHHSQQDLINFILGVDLRLADTQFTEDLIVCLLESYKSDVESPDRIDIIIKMLKEIDND